MKARILLLLLSAVLLLISTSMAQTWNQPQQATTTTYDEKNPTAVAYEDTVILFWDADIEDNRQLYYQIFDRDGTAVGDTVMLTDDGANYAPVAKIFGEFPDHRIVITWESYYDQLRDVAVTMYKDYQWQGVFMAFNQDADEYAPDVTLYQYEDDNYLVVVGQKDHSVLMKRWVINEVGHPTPLQVEYWSTFFDVSNVHVTNITDGFAMTWQEVSFTDTMCFYREYTMAAGWGEEMELDTGTNTAFNPRFHTGYSGNNLMILFNHQQGDWIKVGSIMRDVTNGTWGDVDSEYFGAQQMNQYDPYAAWSGIDDFRGLYMSDLSGNSDIYGDSESGFMQICSSTAEDLNPCYAVPMWSTSGLNDSQRFIAFWETDRNGDWDIYMNTTDVIVPVEDDTHTQILPDKLVLAVYPNPGNSQFRIDLDLPVTGQTQVEIYNTAGQLVEKVSDGLMQAGHHAIDWHPVGQPSGIYLVKVNSEEVQLIQKLVYMK